jgi:Icc-related predicted phosphoesterase
MKILALTDIHGKYETADRIIAAETPDVLVIGGDLTTAGSLKEASDALAMFGKVCARILCVAGNMDFPEHDDMFFQMGCSINGRGRTINGVGFFGVSAAPHSPLKTPYEISEERIMALARAGHADVADAKIKIFVPHAPPHGTRLDVIHNGAHVGSTAVREFIETHTPNVTVCGHIHEARGSDDVGGAPVVNCGQASLGHYAVITTDPMVAENRTLKVGG